MVGHLKYAGFKSKGGGGPKSKSMLKIIAMKDELILENENIN